MGRRHGRISRRGGPLRAGATVFSLFVLLFHFTSHTSRPHVSTIATHKFALALLELIVSTGRAIRRSHALITTLIFHHWTRIVRNLPSEQETRFLCVVVCLYVAVSARSLHAIHMGVAEASSLFLSNVDACISLYKPRRDLRCWVWSKSCWLSPPTTCCCCGDTCPARAASGLVVCAACWPYAPVCVGRPKPGRPARPLWPRPPPPPAAPSPIPGRPA